MNRNPISIIKEYLEISLIFDNGNNHRKENFVILKSFGELKTGDVIQDIWQIKNFNIHVLYEFRCNVLIESPKKVHKNRIPHPNSDLFKRKIAKHEAQILDCDSKKLKKISTSRKNSESVIIYYHTLIFIEYKLRMKKKLKLRRLN